MNRAVNQPIAQRPEFFVAARWLKLFCALLAAICLICCVAECMYVLKSPFTDHRLLPLFLILHHYPVYINPASGPTLSTLYPPLSVLLYAPAALFHSPQACFVTAALISQFLWFAPLLLAFHFVRRPAANSFFDAVLLSTMFVIWSNVSTVLQALCNVHADDPALFLSAAGILAFVADRQRPRALLIVSSAVLCSLAPWAKQPAFPVVFVPLALLLATKNLRRSFLFVACALLTHAAALAVWSRLFDLRLMFLWIFKIPAMQTWKAARLVALGNSNNTLMNENFAALTAIGVVLVWYIRRHGGVNRALISQLSQEPWFVFAAAGLMLWPTSVLGYSKLGGAPNTLLYSTYFIVVGLVLWLYKALPGRPAALTAALWAACVLLVMSAFVMFVKWSREFAPAQLKHAGSIEAYEFSRKWPGEVFFPWYPLSVYLAEGHVYNVDLGMCDRWMAGIEVNRASYIAHLPPHMKYVAYSDAEPGKCALRPIPEYKIRVQDPRLPGWTLYAKQ